jgi:hypothetical protein
MMFDLKVSTGKQKALSKLIGKNLTNNSRVNNSYTVPLSFSAFNKGLPLCAFDDEVTFRIVWNPSVMFTSPAINISAPFSAYLDTEYTYISDQEINFIRSKPQTYLIQQVQREEFFAPQGVNQIQCFTDFVNPVKELFFVSKTIQAVDMTIQPMEQTSK